MTERLTAEMEQCLRVFVDTGAIPPRRSAAAVLAEIDFLRAEATRLREVCQTVLDDTALRSVAGWYDSIQGLRAALTPTPGAEATG